jgi:hypothetical protein
MIVDNIIYTLGKMGLRIVKSEKEHNDFLVELKRKSAKEQEELIDSIELAIRHCKRNGIENPKIVACNF